MACKHFFAPSVLSCGFQVIWKIPEELRREQAGLGSTPTLL
jgi:hypothetical protein